MINWISMILSPVVSIVAIFISNWLGRKSERITYQLNTQKAAYENFYIPLMKRLIQANKDALTYYFFVGIWYGAPSPANISRDFLNDLLRDNLEYLPREIVELVPDYSVATSGAKMFFGNDGYRENYREKLVLASDLFDKIIESSLKEASRLAKTLGYPDIASPILESFLHIEYTDMNYPRYLPEIYQKHSPRQFVGEEPPYY